MSPGRPAAPEGDPPPHAVGIKETVISLLIAFALAFVFRGYVIEPFLIPTGSMAPTLLGAHERFVHPDSGYSWAVGPWYTVQGRSDQPLPQQGGRFRGADFGPITVNDPVTRQPLEFLSGVPSRSGDRIFVLKYVWPFFTPTRYDCVVFKNPQNIQENYIKRLVGLPGEMVALVDGDVFTRPYDRDLSPDFDPWTFTDWKPAVKDPRVQRAVWHTIFDSRYTPLEAPNFVPPWAGDSDAWQTVGTPVYRFTGSAPGRLRWAADGFDYRKAAEEFAALRASGRAGAARGPVSISTIQSAWTAPRLDDTYAFNQILPRTPPVGGVQMGQPQLNFYPVSDLKLAAGFQPDAPNVECSAIILARGHEFRGRLAPSKTEPGYAEASLAMRPAPTSQEPAPPWTILDAQRLRLDLTPGRVYNVEFWHADQTLRLFLDDRPVATGSYAWSPAQRVEFSTGQPYDTLMKQDEAVVAAGDPSVLSYGHFYRKPEAFFELSGPASLHRVTIARDLYYQPTPRSPDKRHPQHGILALAAHPRSTLALGPEQYFLCGDNSAASLDGRAWSDVDTWVAHLIDDTIGVVPERLMVGKAFFVYFPSLHQRLFGSTSIPVPDAGRLRWIW
ncbi:MAG: hypothetical protein HRU70_03780 [Phycisphaeraceae bacterium]|nr:MAG: hypothetical protein HRU70_03780 [Phycisphaeraceae bacterium]